jgi:hypothetical protein
VNRATSPAFADAARYASMAAALRPRLAIGMSEAAH